MDGSSGSNKTLIDFIIFVATRTGYFHVTTVTYCVLSIQICDNQPHVCCWPHSQSPTRHKFD